MSSKRSKAFNKRNKVEKTKLGNYEGAGNEIF